MYHLECKKFTFADCLFIAAGEGLEDTKGILYQHLEKDHPDIVSAMEQKSNKEFLDNTADQELIR